MSGPLARLRVLEVGGIGPLPHAGMILADLGADVVRIERPGAPDSMQVDYVARGKRVIELNLKTGEGVHNLLALVAEADVLLEGYRPGVAERLGIGPDECRAINPALVYGRMTGWGQHGEMAPPPATILTTSPSPECCTRSVTLPNGRYPRSTWSVTTVEVPCSC